MSDVLTTQDKQTLQIAAHGVLALMAGADPGPISSTKAGIAGGLAMSSATGLVGHVLAAKPANLGLKGTIAGIADRVLPALTSSVELLDAKAPEESDNFRTTITAISQSAAQASGGAASPSQAALIAKIQAAVDTA